MTLSLTDLPDYSIGRAWDTDFSDPTADATNFNLVNYIYVTDPQTSLPAVQVDNTQYTAGTDGWAFSKITAKGIVRDCDVLIRFRTPQGNTLAGHFTDGRGAPHAGIQLGTSVWVGGAMYGEDAGVNDYAGLTRDWAGGGQTGVKFGLVNPPPYPITDHTSQRLVRVQKIGNAVRYKYWLEADGEPTEWAYTTIVSPNGGSEFTPWGAAGLFAYQLDSAIISRVTVTELVRTSTNLIHNSDLLLIDSASELPLWWAGRKSAESNAVFSVETLVNQNGQMRPCLKVVSSGDVGDGLWEQQFYNPAALGPTPNDTFTRRYPEGEAFPPLALVTIWSKGAGVAEGGASPFMGAGYINYYYDLEDVAQNVVNNTTDQYYKPLGPNVNTNDPAWGISGGYGTWGWTRTQYVMPYESAVRLRSSTVSLGVHDEAASGTVWIGDVSIRPFDPLIDPDPSAGGRVVYPNQIVTRPVRVFSNSGVQISVVVTSPTLTVSGVGGYSASSTATVSGQTLTAVLPTDAPLGNAALEWAWHQVAGGVTRDATATEYVTVTALPTGPSDDFIALDADADGDYTVSVGESRRGILWPLTTAEATNATGAAVVLSDGAELAATCAIDTDTPAVQISFPDGWSLSNGLYFMRLRVTYSGSISDLILGPIGFTVTNG